MSWRFLVALVWLIGACSPAGRDNAEPETFGFGRIATLVEIDSLDFDVRPDGLGLPDGSGTAIEGRIVFQQKCGRCHGLNGSGGAYGPLVRDTIRDNNSDRREKTIGDYWPYATTVYDYIYRAMPYDSSGTLTHEEVYKLTAFILSENRIIDSTQVIDKNSLPLVKMPAQPLYVNDDRNGGPIIK